MPAKANCSGKGREIDIAEVKKYILSFGEPVGLYVLELVGNIPRIAGGKPIKMGASSMFSFGDSFGMLRALPAIMGWKTLYAPPATWGRSIFYGLKKADSKQRAFTFVTNRYPSVSLRRSDRCTTNHDGIADAVCIGEFGRRDYFGAYAGLAPDVMREQNGSLI